MIQNVNKYPIGEILKKDASDSSKFQVYIFFTKVSGPINERSGGKQPRAH